MKEKPGHRKFSKKAAHRITKKFMKKIFYDFLVKEKRLEIDNYVNTCGANIYRNIDARMRSIAVKSFVIKLVTTLSKPWLGFLMILAE